MKKRNKTIIANSRKKYAKVMPVTIMILFSALITLTFPAVLNAQTSGDVKFEQLSSEQGLSNVTVTCIIQDNQGFMWFGTQTGLNRYDGHEFKTYKSNAGKKTNLCHNLVISIIKERDSGILWIGTLGGGLNKFDPKTEKFSNHKNDEKFKLLKDSNIRSIHEDKDGVLWIGTDKGLYKSDSDKKKFHECSYCKKKDGGVITKINTIYEDKKGNIWIGADDGLYEFKSNGGKKCFKHHIVDTEKDFNIEVNTIYEYQPGELWVGTIIGLYIFNTEQKVFSPLKEKALQDKLINVIFKDKKNKIWVGTWGDGLYKLEPVEKRILAVSRNNPNDFTSLSNNNVLDVYEDKSGLIWIGTRGGGINKLDSKGKQFDLYKNIPDNPQSLSNNEVRGICQDENGGIWVGTCGGGISKFDLENKKFIRYPIGDDTSEKPLKNDVNVIQADHLGNIWVGTFQAGLYKFAPDNEEFYQFKSKSIGKEERILSIYEDKVNYLWIGIQNKGLIKLDKNSKRDELKVYKNDPGVSSSINNNNVFAICDDHSGILWIGTGGGGLNKFDKNKNQFTHYKPEKNNPNSLSHDFVSAVYLDTSKILWIGTLGGGLNKFEIENETFTVYNTEQSLPDNVIYDILEDNNGNLWLTTNRGLARFNPKTEVFRNFTKSDELQGYEFNRGAAFYNKKTDMMFLGGFNGFNVFEPGKIKDTWSPPDIVITSLKILNNNVPLNQYISDSNKLTLSYKENFFSFGFATLSYSDPENNRYAFKLEPLDKDWIPLGNKHDVDFNGLAPGTYTFHVKGAESHGVWNNEGTSIKITITPPFWATWWFYTLIILILIIGVFAFIKFRTRMIKNQNRKLHKLVNERTLEINQQKEELKEAYVNLKASEERYRTLVETSPDAIIFSDAKDGRIIFANQQCISLSGFNNMEEMYKHMNTIYDFVDEKEGDRAYLNFEEVKNRGFIRNNEYTVRSKDGTPIAVEIRTSLIKDIEGKPQYFLSVIRDIRERKEAVKQEKLQQEKLIQVDKMIALGTLVSGVAHEINTPLASIKLNSEIFDRAWHDILPVLDKHYVEYKNFSLADLPYEDSKTRLGDLLTGLKESSQRIEKIINDLRDYSRPSDATSVESIDINKVIGSSLNLTHNMIKKNTKYLTIKLAKNIPKIRGNSQKMEQVFINLIKNACQSLEDNSKKIEISTTYEKEKKEILIKVMDEGSGIKEEHKKYIYDPFFTTRRDQGGTGLGLSISMQILKEHRGRMEFESQEGKGTTVTVILPVND